MATVNDFQNVKTNEKISIEINGQIVNCYFVRIHPSGNSLCWTDLPNSGEYRTPLKDLKVIN